MAHIIFSLTFIAVALYRVLKHPEELAIFILILHSTFRVMVEGNAVAWGEKGSNIRFEYFLFFFAIYLFTRYFYNPSFRTHSSVMRALLALFLVHLASIALAYIWQVKIGFGVVIRQIETFAMVIVLVYLTKRQHVAKLLNAMLIIGGTISLTLLVLNITKNPQLYQLINGRDMGGRLVSIGGEVLGADFGWLAYSINSLPILGCVAFVLFLLKKQHSLWYAVITLIIMLQSLASGQRSPNLVLIAGLALITFTIPVLYRSRVSITKLGLIAGVMALVLFFAFTKSQAMSARLWLLLTRAESTYNGLQSDSQQVGHQLAMEQLNEDGVLAWLFGYSGFILTRTSGRFSYDVNSPIVMVMKFGLIGSAILLYGLSVIFFKTLRMLMSQQNSPEEVAVLTGIVLFILIWLPGSFLRGSVFAENIRMLSWFGCWVAWMEVIDRDRQFETNAWLRSRAHLVRAF
jgi:hypothetical protein